jgi:hypothetical protein
MMTIKGIFMSHFGSFTILSENRFFKNVCLLIMFVYVYVYKISLE